VARAGSPRRIFPIASCPENRRQRLWPIPALVAPSNRSPGQPRPAKARRTAGFLAQVSDTLGNRRLGGGAGSLERTRLRFQPKFTCYCGFLKHLGPSWPRSRRFFMMIQRFNTFSGDIGNTWKTRQEHDYNRPAAGPKQTGSTVATHFRSTCCPRKPDSTKVKSWMPTRLSLGEGRVEWGSNRRMHPLRWSSPRTAG
jgi:hypothetical protein